MQPRGAPVAPVGASRRGRPRRAAACGPAAGDVMGIMKEFESSSTLFGANAPFIEELYEKYLADRESVAEEWREYFDELRGDAQDVAHAPVVESFRELARSRKAAYAMVDSATMHKQVLVLQLISKYRTAGALARRPRPAQAHRAALPRGPRSRHLRLLGGRPRHRVRRWLVQGGPAADAPARHHRRAARHLLPHLRRRVHVHLGHADQALPAAAPRARPRAAEFTTRRASARSSTG